jgi:putative phosphoribosyl transferase
MFHDRRHAGELLAGLLEGYRGRGRTVVLGLPRGGVVVAAALARALALSLDVFVVRKLGAPSQPELAVGAVATGGLVVLDDEAIATMRISRASLEAAIAREREEVNRREQAYRAGRPALELFEQTVLLVDDGVATGYTMLAAVRAVRQLRPDRIVVAVPVASTEAVEMLRLVAEEVFCVLVPRRLMAVGQFYEDFRQTTDDEVLCALREDTLPSPGYTFLLKS